MTDRKITIIDGGSAEYWRQRAYGFRLIHEAERAADRLANAPMYLHGGYDEDGDVIAIENLGPHDDMANAIRAIESKRYCREHPGGARTRQHRQPGDQGGAPCFGA